jgi:glycosyltransferase involved in cell wall biosynthesis
MTAGASHSTVDVTVCICTFNRKNDLRAALASLAAVRIPTDTVWEVVVVDNNSSDGTGAAVAGLQSRMPVRYFVETNQGLSHARNRAVAEARGRILAFLDDDVVVEPAWLQGVVHAFSGSPRPAAVGGPARLTATRPRPRWWHDDFAGVAGHFDRGTGVLSSDGGYADMIGIGANLAFERRVFERYGRFRVDLGRTGKSLEMGEELDFLDRLRRDGERLVYDPGMAVEHRTDPTRVSKSYLRRWYFRFGEWSHASEHTSRAANAPRILGVSRWRFRTAVEDVWRWLRAMLGRRHGDAFRHELHIVAFAGCLSRAWTQRNRGPHVANEPNVQTEHR